MKRKKRSEEIFGLKQPFPEGFNFVDVTFCLSQSIDVSTFQALSSVSLR